MVVKTDVKSVQVYRSCATVTRTGEIGLDEGRNVIYVSGLTSTSKTDGFRLRFPEGIRAINLQVIGIDDIDTEEEKESEKIRKQVEEIEFGIVTCTMMMDLRKTNGDFSGRNDISVEAQESYMVALPSRLKELHEQLTDLQAKKASLTEKLDLAVKEEQKPIIMAELSSEYRGQVPFELIYQENTGYWEPKYEIKFPGDGKPLDVSMKAKIRQNSGEDWKKVKVTLYTGNPSASHNIPAILSEQLSFYEPVPQASPLMGMMGMGMAAQVAGASANAMSMSSAMMMQAAPVKDVAMAEAAVEESENMTAFELPEERDVISGTDGNIALLQSFEVEAEYHVLTIPKLANECYLTADVKTADWPLPSAKASVYIKDSFAGEAYVNVNSGDDIEKFTLSLGLDERVSVVRTELPSKNQEAFIKNQRTRTYSKSIKIVNSSSEDLKILVKDQIPVSTEKTIVVQQTELSGGEVEESSGVVSWLLDAEPKKTIELILTYSVSWPKDKEMIKKNVRITNSSIISVSAGTGTKKRCSLCGEEIKGTPKFCPTCGGVL